MRFDQGDKTPRFTADSLPPDIYTDIVSSGLAADESEARQLVANYFDRVRTGNFEYSLPDLDIESYIRRNPDALRVSTEAAENMGRHILLILGAGRKERVGGQLLELVHAVKNPPKTIIHYRTSRQEAENLKNELGERVEGITQADLGNFDAVHRMFEDFAKVPNVLVNTAATFHLDNRRTLDRSKAEANFSGIFLNNLWTTLLFSLKNRGRPAVAVLFSDWIVETKESYENGYGFYEALSYFVSKGGLRMLPHQLRIGSFDGENEKAHFDPAVRVRVVKSLDQLSPSEQQGNVFIWQKRSRPIPALEDLTSENIKEYAPQIEDYVRENLFEPMLQAADAVNQGKSVILIFPEENWLDHIILNGVTGVKDVFESDDLRVDIIAPGPTIPPPDMTPEELTAVARHSLMGWSGAGPIAEAVLQDILVEFVEGNMQGKTHMRASGRDIVAKIRKMTEG